MEEKKEEIRYLRDAKNLSFNQIEEKIGISRRSVSRIYYNSLGGTRKKRASILDPYRSLMISWFSEYPSLKACQVSEWLKERGVKVDYTLVVKYTRAMRKKKKNRIFHELTFLPGEEGQVDWAHIIHPILGKLYCFVFILSYSRYLFAHIFPKYSFEFFIEGHLKAFSHMGGYPFALRYDNLKSVVLKRYPQIKYNPHFLEFMNHYNIEVRVCNPYSGNEKGRVERSIRTIRETFLVSAGNIESIGAMNYALSQWVAKKNDTIHRSTGKKPIDMLKEENLKRLPEIGWENICIHPPVKTTKTGMMIFDTNYYSVPEYLVEKPLSIHSTPYAIKIYDQRNKEVANHPRSFERGKKILNPIHRTYISLSTKAKLDRIYHVIKKMGPKVEEFLLKNESIGEDPYMSAYQIFKTLKGIGRSMFISIIEECLSKNNPRIKTYLSYLHIEPEEKMEIVHPQNKEILNISYERRSLEVYNEK